MLRYRKTAAVLLPLAVLAALFALAAPAHAIEYDCKPGANSWSTLSAFNNGQVFEARTCTEHATSGPNFGKNRTHTAVRCRLGTYGPHENDKCNIIYGDIDVFAFVWEPAGQQWALYRQDYYGPGTYNDSSAHYYTAWDCPGTNRSDLFSGSTSGLQAQSSSGQVGSEHTHSSYTAETGCGSV